MKIGFIDFVFEPWHAIGTNGLSEVVWNMAAGLTRLGHETHIAGPYKPDAEFPDKRVIVHSFALPPINYRNIVGHMLIVNRAARVLRQHGPFDVLHAPDCMSTASMTLHMPRTPVVLTEPGNIYERLAHGNPYDPWTTQVLKIATRVSALRVSKIVATSEIMEYWWRRSGAAQGKIARIPLGVDLGGFTRQPDAAKQIGWDKKGPNILFVARLSVETGGEYLLRAFVKLRAKYPDAQLHMVGNGLAEGHLHRLAAQLGIEEATHWYGWLALTDLPLYYSAADVFCFPGSSGGTPRVMLQAMACGAPFVGSAIGGITDHMQKRNGNLVPPRDPAALAEALLEVLADPAEARQMAQRGSAYVQELQWSRIAARVADEVYAPLLATNNGRLVREGTL